MAVRMRSLAGWCAAVALTAAAFPEWAFASSMRCGSRLLSEGMLAAEAQALCGEPDFRDVWASPGGYGYGAGSPTEEWVYNRGSSQLLRVLRIRNGRIERIATEGYGFAPQSARNCGQAEIRRDMSKYRLVSRCGEPIARIADYVMVPAYRHPHHRHHDLRNQYAVSPVYREEWTYNFGSNQLLRVVILENGRVVDVRVGRRGFDP